MEWKAGKEEHVMVVYICLFIGMAVNQEYTNSSHQQTSSTQDLYASEHQKLQIPVDLEV